MRNKEKKGGFEHETGTVETPKGTGAKESEMMHNGVDISKHRELTVASFSGSYQDVQIKNLEESNFQKSITKLTP